MNQNDWLRIPRFVCRTCSIELVVTATEKRPVSEFYAVHPVGPGLCPLKDDVVLLNSYGEMTEKLVENGVTLKSSKAQKKSAP